MSHADTIIQNLEEEVRDLRAGKELRVLMQMHDLDRLRAQDVVIADLKDLVKEQEIVIIDLKEEIKQLDEEADRGGW